MKEFKLRISSPKELELIPVGNAMNNVEIHKDYVKVNIYKKSTLIKKGDVVTLDQRQYTVNDIEVTKDKILLIEYKKNWSTSFLLPLLFNSPKAIGMNKYLIGCYCFYEDIMGYYLLYRYNPKSKEMLEIEDMLQRHDRYYSSWGYGLGKIIFSFKLSSFHRHIIELMLDGKYSKFPEEYKRRLLKFYNNNKLLRAVLRENDILYYKRKEEMEKEYECSIPEDIDLISKPEIEEESLYDYI